MELLLLLGMVLAQQQVTTFGTGRRPYVDVVPAVAQQMVPIVTDRRQRVDLRAHQRHVARRARNSPAGGVQQLRRDHHVRAVGVQHLGRSRRVLDDGRGAFQPGWVFIGFQVWCLY